MRIFKTKTAQEDITYESVNETLKELTPSYPSASSIVTRSHDDKGVFGRGRYRFKCSTHSGFTMLSAKEAAIRCYEDAVKLRDGFQKAGFTTKMDASPDEAELYTGFGAIYIKCIVYVNYNGSPDIINSTASKLGVKR